MKLILLIVKTASPWFTFRYQITLSCGVQEMVPSPHSSRLGLNWLNPNKLPQLLGHSYSFMDGQDSDLSESMHCVLLATQAHQSRSCGLHWSKWEQGRKNTQMWACCLCVCVVGRKIPLPQDVHILTPKLMRILCYVAKMINLIWI